MKDHLPDDEASCESYLPGHRLHWSLYKMASGASTVPVRRVIQNGTRIELVVRGEKSIHWRHHDPRRLAAALERSTDPILACPEWRALRVDGLWFNCAPQAADLSVCS